MTVQDLKAFGANIEEGLSRCVNNEGLYLRLVGMAIDDAGFERLGAQLEANDANGAFESAHGLKGVLGNLALTPLYEPVSELTELLRDNREGDIPAGCDALYKTVVEQREKLAALR